MSHDDLPRQQTQQQVARPAEVLDLALENLTLWFGAVEQVIESHLVGQVEDALRVISGGFVHSRSSAGPTRRALTVGPC